MRRWAIMGLGLGLGLGYHGVVGGFLACCHGRWGGWWVLGGGVSMVVCPTAVGIFTPPPKTRLVAVHA